MKNSKNDTGLAMKDQAQPKAINLSGIPMICGSTATIMRVLYESLMPTEQSKAKVDSLLIILMSQAQSTYTNLSKTTELQNVTGSIDTSISAIKDANVKNSFLNDLASIQTKAGELETFLKENVMPKYKKVCELHAEICRLTGAFLSNKASPGDQAKLSAAIESLKTETRAFRNAATQYSEQFAKIKNDQHVLHKAITGKEPPREALAPRLT